MFHNNFNCRKKRDTTLAAFTYSCSDNIPIRCSTKQHQLLTMINSIWFSLFPVQCCFYRVNTHLEKSSGQLEKELW